MLEFVQRYPCPALFLVLPWIDFRLTSNHITGIVEVVIENGWMARWMSKMWQ